MRRVKKSRNGCARCKSKRVKCGEEKPHCNRCTRLGVRCPGYVQSLKWVTKYEEPSPGASSDGKAISPTPQRSPRQSSHHHDSIERALSVDEPNGGGSSHDLDPTGFGLDASNSLCDNLWDLPGNGSLPELTDLCPSPIQSASVFQESHHGVQDFLSSADSAVDLSHFLSLIGPTHNEEEEVRHAHGGTSANANGGGGSIYRDFSPSAIVRSYPPAQQRSTSRDFMSLSRPLNNPSWTLIEYYFKEVAALFSSYDSQMNPFRTTVSRLWGSSLAMCRTMQSMAAATLVNDFPQFGPMGRKMRDEAVDIITREAVMDDKALLALLMLGQTASWHDPKDLGISFFNLLRKQLTTGNTGPLSNANTANNPGQEFNFVKSSTSNNYRFFEEALIYWEMLLSFVADNDMVFSDTQASSSGESLVLQRVPHPWTGIARDTQFTVHEVGRLVRRERKRIRARRFTSQEEITRAQIAIEKARELEERLLALAHPTEAEIVSPGDDETPVWHLLTMAEVYRCTGLMQLYRVFPDLLRNRLPNPSSTSHSARDPFNFPIDLDSMNMSAGGGFDTSASANANPGSGRGHAHGGPGPSNHHHSHHHTHPSPSTTNTYTPAADLESDYQDSIESLYNNWLTEFAITTLSRLKTIPLESRTRCLQPFLLVASSSELRLPQSDSNPNSHSNSHHHQSTSTSSSHPRRSSTTHTQSQSQYQYQYPAKDSARNRNDGNIHHHPEHATANENENEEFPSSPLRSPSPESNQPSISMEAIEISRTRRFILGRLTSFLHVLPPKPINVCLRLVREVWRRMDAGEVDTYWIDVMIEKGWETTMG